MGRFVIRRTDPAAAGWAQGGLPAIQWLSRTGFTTYQFARAARFSTLAAAEDERRWFATNYPRYAWTIETGQRADGLDFAEV